jgi:hypothetical protein
MDQSKRDTFRNRVKPVRRAAGTDTTPRAWQTCPRIAIQVAAKFIVRRITRNEQMGDYIVAGPPRLLFDFNQTIVGPFNFLAIFALRVDLVRSVRVDAQDSTHESAVKASRTRSFSSKMILKNRIRSGFIALHRLQNKSACLRVSPRDSLSARHSAPFLFGIHI